MRESRVAADAGSGWDEIPAIQDKEVSEPEGDRFGHRDLELALRGLLESKNHEPPYSVGLLGRWGSGKSTVRALYETRLAEDSARSGRVRTISFDAWRFGKEEVKRALLRHLFLSLGGDDSELRDELYRQVQRHSTENRRFPEIMADLRALWKAVVVQFLLLLGVVLVVAVVLLFVLRIDTALARSLVVTAAIATVPLLARYLLNPVPWRANVTRLDLPRTTAEQYEEFLRDRLVRFGKDNPGTERLVVFVDDLDRLPAEEMVDGLDAVRGFMDLPGGTAGVPGVVFVISCDEGKVAEALADRRRRNDSELPATITGKDDARRYLDRIFQFRLEVPPPPKRDMRGYAKRRLEEDLALIAEDLKGRKISLDDVVDRMIHPGVQSPRTAVHMLNSFSRGWWLARRRERAGGATRAGGLVEGAVTNHPQTLAALAALQVDFPEFYDDLQETPDLLDAFSRVFVDGASLEDQPTGLHNVLEGYRFTNADGDGQGGNAVKPRHRPLRSFVSGLRGMRRPRNLRPLIELSQDQLSRDLGPRGAEIRAAFVDGDARGVLESFGRADDDRALSVEEVARLKDVVEDTEGETATRQDNSGVVLAAIAGRVPEERAGALLDPLAFRLRESRDLRSRVGVASIADLLPRLRREDQRDLAGTLVADLLRTDGDVALETPNLQAQSLEDAITMAREAVEAVLGVRERFGLHPSSEQSLLDWLEVRRVSSGGEAHELPFSDLERWVGRHEELLTALGARYTAMVATEIEDKRALSEASETARRSREIFALLAAGGRQDYAVLWAHLTSYVSAENPEIARAGWEFAMSDTSTADPTRFNAFVGALADRASRAGEYHEDGGTVAPGAGDALVRVYRSRPGDVGDEAREKVAELATYWGRDYYEKEGRHLGTYAAGLAEAIAAKGAQFSPLLNDWSGRLLGDLGPTCRRWLASFLQRLNGPGRKTVIGGLAEVTGNSTVDDDVAERYAEFVSALTDGGKATEEVREHLGQVVRQAAALVIDRSQAPSYADFSPVVTQVRNYVPKILPIIAPALSYAPPDDAEALLNGVFINGLYIDHARPLFAGLHRAMVGHWPASGNVPYDPEAVFNRAEEAAFASPDIVGAPDLLHSMASVINANGLGIEHRRRLVDAACTLWPHRQEFAFKTITSNNEPPSPRSVALLAVATDPDNAEERSRLSGAWAHCARLLSGDGVAHVSRALLERAPDEEAGDPDWALDLWLGTVPDPAPMLQRFFDDPETVDEDLERLWRRTLHNAERLGPSFFRASLPRLFAREEVERTVSAVRSGKDQVTELFVGPGALRTSSGAACWRRSSTLRVTRTRASSLNGSKMRLPPDP